MNLLRAWLPLPGLSAAIVLTWLLLARGFGAADVLLAALVALVVPHLVAGVWSRLVRVRRPRVVAAYVVTVLFDVILSNVAVGWGAIRWPWRQPSSRFVIVPLDLRDPLGLAVLAMVTTIVPGTVWSELALDRSTLLLHVWDVDDENAFVRRYKARYERPLREIFE